ncbi:MAG: isoamylase early set domain-containing protein [Anaerolineales bacterium]
MITKSYSRGGRACRVRFELPAEVQAESAHLCGDFNPWDQSSIPMTLRQDGSLEVTVSLKPGQEYRFRYWLDRDRWENGRLAEAYVANPFGGEDSVVRV